MQQTIILPEINQSFLDPNLIGTEFPVEGVFQTAKSTFDFFTNPNTWQTVGIVSGLFSIILIGGIIYFLVRIKEMQIDDAEKLEENIIKTLIKDKEIEKKNNPRWHYITTLVESPNSSDWRVAVIEADTMMEEVLKDRGLSGETVSELLESAKASGYPNIQNAWDAHIVRNQIAHQGVDFPLTQNEARRTIRKYESFFEDLGVVK